MQKIIAQLKEMSVTIERLFEVKTERISSEVQSEIVQYAASIFAFIIGTVFILLAATVAGILMVDPNDTLLFANNHYSLTIFATIGIAGLLAGWLLVSKKINFWKFNSKSLKQKESELESTISQQIDSCIATIKEESSHSWMYLIKQAISVAPSAGLSSVSGVLLLKKLFFTPRKNGLTTPVSIRTRLLSGLTQALNAKTAGVAIALVPLIVSEIIKENRPAQKPADDLEDIDRPMTANGIYYS